MLPPISSSCQEQFDFATRQVYFAAMLDEKAIAQFKEWGAQGGKVRAKKFTKQQLSAMAKRAWRRLKARRNGK